MVRIALAGSSATSTAPTRWLRRNALMAGTVAPLIVPMPSCACAAGDGSPGGATPRNPPASRNEKLVSACHTICRLCRGSTIHTISPGGTYVR